MILLLAASFFSLAHSDCLDEARLKSVVLENFKMEALNPSKPLDYCKTDSLAYRVADAILLLSEVTLSPRKENDPFDKGFLEGAPFDFFKKRVKIIQIDELEKGDPKSDCQDGRAAYVAAGETKPRIVVCPPAAKNSALQLSSILLHEARHLEQGGYHHVICRSGSFVGKPSCDNSYEDGGSYAIGTEYQVKVWRSEHLPMALRKEARELAISDFLERFNVRVLDLREGALLQTEAGAWEFYDGDSQVKLPFDFSSSKVIAYLRNGLATFFQPFAGKIEAYVHSKGGLKSAPSDVLVRKFHNELTAAEQTQLKDVVYGTTFACLMLETSLDCISMDRKNFKIDIKHFVPKSFLFTKNSRLLYANRVHILGEDGYLYLLPESAEELRAKDPTLWMKSSEPSRFAKVAPFGMGYEILLNSNQEVMVYNKRQRTVSESLNLEKKKYRTLVSPFIWSEKLRDL